MLIYRCTSHHVRRYDWSKKCDELLQCKLPNNVYKVCKDPSTEIAFCVSDMVFAETKYNYQIAIVQMASTPSPSLN